MVQIIRNDTKYFNDLVQRLRKEGINVRVNIGSDYDFAFCEYGNLYIGFHTYSNSKRVMNSSLNGSVSVIPRADGYCNWNDNRIELQIPINKPQINFLIGAIKHYECNSSMRDIREYDYGTIYGLR